MPSTPRHRPTSAPPAAPAPLYSRPMRHRRHRPPAGPALAATPVLALILGLVLAVAGACGPSEEQSEADHDEIRQLLEAYLPVLGEAYATGDTAPLEGLAAAKEAFAAAKRIADFAREGRRVEPTFRDLTLEDVVIYQHSNAYVTTVERWDVRIYAAGSERLISEQLDQVNRVKYQLKRTDDGWRVLYRTLEGEDLGS